MINLIDALINKLSKIDEKFRNKIFQDYSEYGESPTEQSEKLVDLCGETFKKIKNILIDFKKEFTNISNPKTFDPKDGMEDDWAPINSDKPKLARLSKLFSNYK